MTDVRCPQCAAHVAVGAHWCGQCYASMAGDPVKPPRPPVRADEAPQVIRPAGFAGSVALLGDPPAPPPPPPTAPPAESPPALRLGRQPWPCVRCETVNPYEANACTACGLGFLDGLSEPPARLPLIGSIENLGRAGKVKLGVLATLALGVPLVLIFTIAGLLLH